MLILFHGYIYIYINVAITDYNTLNCCVSVKNLDLDGRVKTCRTEPPPKQRVAESLAFSVNRLTWAATQPA